jgi:hypothetical protein
MFSQKKALFPRIALLISIIVASFSLFCIDYRYDYAQFEKKINTSFVWTGVFFQRGELYITGDSTSLVMSFDKKLEYAESNIVVNWYLEWKKYTRMLDTEDGDDTNRFFTFPFVTNKEWLIIYTISADSPVLWISLIQIQMSSSPFLTLRNPLSKVEAESWGIPIISRASWWADERLRFWSDSSLQKEKQAWEDRWRTPFVITETEADSHIRTLDMKRGERIMDIRWDAAKIVSLKRYEDGKKLLWPIKKTGIVDRIVIHHTAENLEQDVDDTTLLRAIYAYHARTRGWWDIGYNYIVGQRGQIYEWRAWGDYVEWAHAFANNLGSVGISVIGNFETMKLNRDQRKWLEEAIVFFAKKYGVNILDTTIGVRACKLWWDCLFDENIVYRLHGHRDVGYTSCPGTNLYTLLDEIRTNLASRIGPTIPVKNPNPWIIEWVPLEDEIQYIAKNTAVPQKILAKPTTTLRWWKIVKIRLSYPGNDEIVLEGPLYVKPDIRIGKKKIPSQKWDSMKIHTDKNNMLTAKIGGKVYSWSSMSFASDIVRINSWTRIPTWDTTRQYNDNTFRWKITLYNNDGKLLVVNELPIESYLKGLWEVSNTDLEEKIKTIIIAARTYARYYTDPKNRKYNTTLYDWVDDPDSFQRYLWYGYEERSPRVSTMVDMTRWEVVTYEWKIVKTWYFSSSDWRTLSYEEYCKKSSSMNCMNIPYLQSVDDPGWIWKSRAGHGVWISGIWATHFALEWWGYKKIIAYYMNGVEIMKK